MGLQYKVVYKKGILNGAADALSRKPPYSSELLAITTVQPSWLDKVSASYVGDEQAQRLMQKLAVDPLSEPHFTLRDGCCDTTIESGLEMTHSYSNSLYKNSIPVRWEDIQDSLSHTVA